MYSNLFYKLINQISKTPIMSGARDYRMMTRQMVNVVLSLSEYNRFSKGIFSWVGFDTYYISYENRERSAGETTWNFWSLFKYSLEGIINFSEAPLTFATLVGLGSCIISILAMIYFFLDKNLISFLFRPVHHSYYSIIIYNFSFDFFIKEDCSGRN